MQTEKVIHHIVDWLDQYAHQAGTAGFVAGVSGGIDSAVTSTLIARTGRPVLIVEMPIHQAENQVRRARDHISWLRANHSNVGSVEVRLTPVFDTLIDALPAVEDDERRNMALANTRARLRMTTLYYFAALHGHLVAGTGNKVEDFGVGFYTKYGDGGVDLSPIADLTKTEVYVLGRALGVGEAILQAPPTDGLWGDNRTDEDQIGATYPELEWAMDYVARGEQDEPLDARQREVLRIYHAYNRANRHKMEPIPVCRIPDTLRS